jgi:hypothetical protein
MRRAIRKLRGFSNQRTLGHALVISLGRIIYDFCFYVSRKSK